MSRLPDTASSLGGMTPREHYDEAEELLSEARNAAGGSAREAYFLAAAQVHATLALYRPTSAGA